MATTAPHSHHTDSLIHPRTPDPAYCAGSSCAAEVARAVGVLAGRWAVPVIEALYTAPGGIGRFRELQRRMPGISQKELSRQLVQFVNLGVAQRQADVLNPRQVDYRLTARGLELLKHMDGLGQWAKAATGLAVMAPVAAAVARAAPPASAATWLSPLSSP